MYACSCLLASEPEGRGPNATARLVNSNAEVPEKPAPEAKRGNNNIAKAVKEMPDNRKLVDEIYYAILNRPATNAEAAAVDLGTGEKRLEVAQDLAWALLNTPAFLFNR